MHHTPHTIHHTGVLRDLHAVYSLRGERRLRHRAEDARGGRDGVRMRRCRRTTQALSGPKLDRVGAGMRAACALAVHERHGGIRHAETEHLRPVVGVG